MNEGKLKAHDHYMVKKEVAKLYAAESGLSFKEAFEAIPDELINTMDYNAIYAKLNEPKPKKAKK